MSLEQLPDPTEGLVDAGAREWLTTRVIETVEAAVMKLGELLELGRSRLGKEVYDSWVTDDLPFGLDTAKRYRAIWRAYSELDAEVLKRLPRPWQAMYALSAVASSDLRTLVAEGQVSPSTTVADARTLAQRYRADRWTGEAPGPEPRPSASAADRAAMALMEYDPSELSPRVRVALDAWL